MATRIQKLEGKGCAAQDTGDVSDDVLRYFGDGEGKNSDDDAEPESPGDDCAARLPEDAEDGGHVPKRSQPLAPWALSIHKVFQIAPKVEMAEGGRDAGRGAQLMDAGME